MPEQGLPKGVVEKLHNAIFRAIEPHAEDLRLDETHGEAVTRVLHRELPAIIEQTRSQERERVREGLLGSGWTEVEIEAAECPDHALRPCPKCLMQAALDLDSLEDSNV